MMTFDTRGRQTTTALNSSGNSVTNLNNQNDNTTSTTTTTTSLTTSSTTITTATLTPSQSSSSSSSTATAAVAATTAATTTATTTIITTTLTGLTSAAPPNSSLINSSSSSSSTTTILGLTATTTTTPSSSSSSSTPGTTSANNIKNLIQSNNSDNVGSIVNTTTGGFSIESTSLNSDTNSSSSDGGNGVAAESISPEKLIASFPVLKLRSLTQKISNPRWVVPVLPEQELEVLLNAAIELTAAGVDHDCEPCVEFYHNALTTSFTKILTDEAVNSWKYNIHHCILQSCGKLLHLIAIHMTRDNPYLLGLLGVVFDPDNKFNTFNAARQPECYQSPGNMWGVLEPNKVFAKPLQEPNPPRGWLVDMINRFGQFGGFDNLLERFNNGLILLKRNQEKSSTPSDSSNNDYRSLTSSKCSNSSDETSHNDNKITLGLIYSLLRPFGQCYELLTPSTIEKYFMPIWIVVLDLLDSFSDEELKREAKPEGRNDYINAIVKAARYLASRLPGQEELIRELEMFRLKMILRLLQVSSFNGKMNALNEINKVLSSVSYYSHHTPKISHCMLDDDMEWLTAERMATWIKESNVLGIVLKDSLHQPQYVEKLEKIIRFLIKEQALTLEDLDEIWKAQAGKHEAIVKNVHDLLAKLAWDFTPEQLDHLFESFQASMTTANKRQRERLLELIRRLAEDDKNGVMAQKVLKLFWTLAHSQEIPPEVLDQALASHVKILDYSCSQERDAQKIVWLDKCVGEVKAGENWVLPALRLIREICCLYESAQNHTPRAQQFLTRQQVIERLQNDYSLVILVTNSLSIYMDKIKKRIADMTNVDPLTLCIDGRYPHSLQITERLEFLKYLLKDGQLWLCADQAKQIWNCLAVNAIFPSDREECFRWFGKLMGEEPDLDPGINKDFFENNVMQLDPQLLSESGIRCFERFFKAVNSKDDKLKAIHRGYMLDNEDLLGKDYLWRVITTAGEEIANRGIDLLKEVSTALGPRLQENIIEFHEMFISECCERLKTHYSNILVLGKASTLANITEETQLDQIDCKDMKMRFIEAEKMCRILRVLQEYIKECDRSYNGDRLFLPLARASRGKHITLYIRFQTPGRPIDDIEIATHNNETVASFKRQLLKRIKGNPSANIKIEFFYNNGEMVDINDDINPLYHYSIRDKLLLTAKLTPLGNAPMTNSPDTSSESSTGSPPRTCPEVPRGETENALPGVIISQNYQYMEFFMKLYQLGCDLEHPKLRETAKCLMQLLPCDRQTIKILQIMCHLPGSQTGKGDDVDNKNALAFQTQECTPENVFLHPSPAHVYYNLSVLSALLIPALEPFGESSLQMQASWLHSGCAHFVLELLTKNNFLPNADPHTKRSCFLSVLRLSRLFLYIIACVLARVGDDALIANRDNGSRSQVEILKHIMNSIPGSSENCMRVISTKLGESLAAEMLSATPEGERFRSLFHSSLNWQCPDLATIKAVIQLAWASSSGSIQSLGLTNDFSDMISMPDPTDFMMCKEALELLTISLVLNANANDALTADSLWPKFIISLILKNPSRHVRQIAAEQIFLTCSHCAGERKIYMYMINLLVTTLRSIISHHEATCADFFQLLCRTIAYGCIYNWSLSIAEVLLAEEIKWLQHIKENVAKTGDIQVHEDLLEGHLSLAKELVIFLSPESKAQLNDLIQELIDDFLFTASKEYLHLRKTGKLKYETAPPPVCRSPHTISAACDLLIVMCQNCVPNMKLLTNTLIDFVCTDTDPLREWEYLPPVGARPPKGFCGLKNAGATCYMNSVLQQLYMVPSIRLGLLKAEGAAVNELEDFSMEADSLMMINTFLNSNADEKDPNRNYHVVILKHVQAIFAHLAHSALQFYIPRGLWTHFKLQGEPVNLREQQDAVEFFMSLFESLDEGLKALGHTQLMNATLGGSFSDQKICQECPHRYSKEEPFSVFSVDIRNHSSLTESLEQYVKGELLEGADAYHCDKCDKKVVTIKRLCVKKLPPVLAIQLKRFEYDYERVCAIKFNDYFEFPRVLDMEPYTVSGLAKLEGEIIEVDDSCQANVETKYELTGIVVHSGQASGGHYFSYILSKNPVNGKEQWYKFDDGEVTECKMHEDDELKAQCFGGDYMGEIYDNNLKRMLYRRQKRWWNAYMLFYTRCDQKPIEFEPSIEQLSLAESRNAVLPLPKPIERSVRHQNIRFLHSRSIFSVEFFSFVKKLVTCILPNTNRAEKYNHTSLATEELSLLGVQLGTQFLFHTGFRTKKSLRGPVIDWYDTISFHIRSSAIVRRWFGQNALLNPPSRLCEYILTAPSPEVRTVFVKLVVFFCHFSRNDEPMPCYEGNSLCEQVLICVLKLLKCEAAEHGKHLPHYFSLFNMYVGLGVPEKLQLLRLNVPAIFMQLASDEGPGPSIKYQYPELTKLHQVVSHLIRCTDISEKCTASGQSSRVLPNPYKDPNISYDELAPLSPECSEMLFSRTVYIKKIIEDTNVGEEGLKLLQYCCWENPHFSRAVLTELLWQCGFAYCHDMRHHTELLLHILLIEDSWQHHRVHNALMGVAEEREGLLDTIQRSKTHYQKRAYQIIKCLAHLFHKSPVAKQMLYTNQSVGRHWTIAVEWLQDELERQRSIVGVQYNSYSWSPPAQSNDNTNGYMLERSQSAKNTWSMAHKLCPEDEQEESVESDASDDVQRQHQHQQQIQLKQQQMQKQQPQQQNSSQNLSHQGQTSQDQKSSSTSNTNDESFEFSEAPLSPHMKALQNSTQAMRAARYKALENADNENTGNTESVFGNEPVTSSTSTTSVTAQTVNGLSTNLSHLTLSPRKQGSNADTKKSSGPTLSNLALLATSAMPPNSASTKKAAISSAKGKQYNDDQHFVTLHDIRNFLNTSRLETNHKFKPPTALQLQKPTSSCSSSSGVSHHFERDYPQNEIKKKQALPSPPSPDPSDHPKLISPSSSSAILAPASHSSLSSKRLKASTLTSTSSSATSCSRRDSSQLEPNVIIQSKGKTSPKPYEKYTSSFFYKPVYNSDDDDSVASASEEEEEGDV